MEAWKFSDWEANGKDEAVKVRKRPRHEEDNLQRNCVRWFDIQHPGIKLLLHHSPNEGYRSEREGARNRDLGTRRGFPDLILLKSNGTYDYCAIEMKTESGRLTAEQKDYRDAIGQSGGCYIVIRGLTDFVAAVNDYLDNRDMEPWIKKR